MATMSPAAARALWLALLDNAARIVVEADALFPSPRAQSLVVLALEEVGKAVWDREAFATAWYGTDETDREVSELHSLWRAHSAKLMAVTEYGTAMMEVPGGTEPVEIELVRAHAPEFLITYLKQTARADNKAKQQGFYVDLEVDGSFTVPHEIDRPLLRNEIWSVADVIKWSLEDDQMMCSIAGKPRPSTSDWIAKKVESLLVHDPDEWTEARD